MRLTVPTLLTLCLALAACGGSEPSADAPAAVDANAAGTTASATTVPVGNDADAMATLPDYVPLIPGGTLMMADERGGILSAAIQAPGSVKDTAAFYEQTLKNNDMNPAKQTGVGDGVELTSREKGRQLKITVGPAPNGDAIVGVTDRPGG